MPKRRLLLIAAGLLGLLAAFVLILTGVLRRPVPYARPALAYEQVAEGKLAYALQNNPELEPLRQIVVDSAASLNGKVTYFWGGKSEAIGFDPEWGQPQLVESAGSETTGTIQPYGLDCSGYIAWCFIQSGMSFDQVKSAIGLGSTSQWKRSREIGWEEIQPGDFVFQRRPNTGDGNHVGIVLGFDERGEPVIAHCSFSLGGCVVTGRGDIFVFARRPYYYENEENA